MTWIALLRGINVGGHKPIAMADLRALLGDLGYGRPRTLLQSGNAVFESDGRSAERMEGQLEAALRKRFAVDVGVLARTAAEWQAVVDRNPFPIEARRDPARLVLLCTKDTLTAGHAAALREAIVGRETIECGARHAYVVYPDGQGRSKFTLTLIEKTIGMRATARNWNTVLKLNELSRQP